jgi:hypothetical protein
MIKWPVFFNNNDIQVVELTVLANKFFQCFASSYLNDFYVSIMFEIAKLFVI